MVLGDVSSWCHSLTGVDCQQLLQLLLNVDASLTAILPLSALLEPLLFYISEDFISCALSSLFASAFACNGSIHVSRCRTSQHRTDFDLLPNSWFGLFISSLLGPLKLILRQCNKTLQVLTDSTANLELILRNGHHAPAIALCKEQITS